MKPPHAALTAQRNGAAGSCASPSHYKWIARAGESHRCIGGRFAAGLSGNQNRTEPATEPNVSALSCVVYSRERRMTVKESP
jgi:hypothetical protein